MDFDINDVEEIVVITKSGQELIYKSKGIARLRRIMSTPVATAPTTRVIDSDFDEDDHEPRVKTEKSKPTSGGHGGYNVMHLKYEKSAEGRSPQDIAKDLQRQAEQASGIRY